MKGILKKINISVKDKVILDVGSSHGGFVQVMLLNAVRRIYAVDVGKGLLDFKLRNIQQVTVMEGTNAKDLKKDQFEDIPHIGLIDVSFISLKKIIPVVFDIVTEKLLALVKPQFEATYKETSKGRGIIENTDIHMRVIQEIKDSVKNNKWNFVGTYPSEVKGRKGNQEYFIYYERIRTQ